MEITRYIKSNKSFSDEEMIMIVIHVKSENFVDHVSRIFDGITQMFIGTKEWHYSCDETHTVMISVSYKNDIGQLFKALSMYDGD